MNNEKSICETFFEEKLKLPVCCIVPAAGLSSRMGEWKGELMVPSKPKISNKQISLIEKTVNTALESCAKVILVAGEKAPRIKDIFTADESLFIIENEEFQKGMLSSIQKALSLVDQDFFIIPLDMPLINSNHIYRLHKEYSLKKKQKIYRPVYKDTPGHPVFLPLCWKDKILTMNGSSLKNKLQAVDQILIPWEDESVVLDLDTRESYENFMRSYSKSSD